MDDMGTALAIQLGCDTASRGANWVTTDTSEQAVETQDLRFQVGQGEPDANGTYNSYEAIRGHMLNEQITIPGNTYEHPKWDTNRVHSLELDHLSTKTGPVTNIKIGRRSQAEMTLLTEVVTWLMLSRPKKAEPFLTRYGLTKFGKKTSRRALRSSDITAALKQAASTLHLPISLFSAKSMRQTGNTELNLAELPEELVKARTGHSEGSRIGDVHYNFALSQAQGGRGVSVGAAALNVNGTTGFTMDLLKDTLTPSTWKTGPTETGQEPKTKRPKTKTSEF
jgi:hypothetical protein